MYKFSAISLSSGSSVNIICVSWYGGLLMFLMETFAQVKLLTIWSSKVDDHGWSIDWIISTELQLSGVLTSGLSVLIKATVFLGPNGVLFAPVSLTWDGCQYFL